MAHNVQWREVYCIWSTQSQQASGHISPASQKPRSLHSPGSGKCRPKSHCTQLTPQLSGATPKYSWAQTNCRSRMGVYSHHPIFQGYYSIEYPTEHGLIMYSGEKYIAYGPLKTSKLLGTYHQSHKNPDLSIPQASRNHVLNNNQQNCLPH